MKRDRCIDIAKGIAILLVVLGHSYSLKAGCNLGVKELISSFHMPFFFLVSGILYRRKYNISGKVVFPIIEKAKALLLPWILWGGLYQAFLSTLKLIGGSTIDDEISIFSHELFSLGFGSVWFLPALFCSLYLMLNTVKYKTVSGGLLVSGILVGVVFSDYDVIDIPFARVMVACTFIGVGFYMEQFLYKKHKNLTQLSLVFIIFVGLAEYNTMVGLYSMELGRIPLLFFVTGILGSYLLIQGSIIIVQCENRSVTYIVRFLEIFGKNSIVVLCLHNFILEGLFLLDYKLGGGKVKATGLPGGIMFTLVTALILWYLIPVCIRYLNPLFGGKTMKRCEKQ